MAIYQPYTAGSVTAVNGSPTITGSSTTWTDVNASAGSIITIVGVDYTIQTRDSSTQLTLTANYAGTTSANLTYIIGTIKNPTPLTAAEVLVVSSGAVVWITNGTYTATGGAGAITINDGLLKITNTSTSSGFKFTLATASTGVTLNSRGIEATGNWISIGTGNGNSGQTFTHWDTTGDFIPCVWIETSSGSGVYEKYYNLTGIAAAHTITMARVGAGKYGKFFTQSGAVITFGDGTNGKVPPNGANVRVPNIIFSYVAALSTTFPILGGLTVGGEVRLDTVQMSRIMIGGQNSNRLIRVYRSSLLGGTLWGHAYDTVLKDCGFGHNKTDNISLIKVNSASAPARNFILTNCGGWNFSNSAATSTLSFLASEVIATSCEFFAISNVANTIATGVVITADIYSKIKITGSGSVWSGSQYITGNWICEDTEVTDNPRLSEDSVALTRALFLFQTGSNSCIIRNVTVPTGGGCYNFISIPSSVYLNNLQIYNLTVNSTYFTYGINSASTLFQENWKLYNWDFPTVTNLFIAVKAINGLLQNIRSNSYQNILSSFQTNSQNTIFRAVPFTNVPNSTTTGALYDNFYYTTYTAATEGAFGLVFSLSTAASSNYVTLTGTAQLTGTQIYLPKTGDTATFECPYKILGFSSIGATVPGGEFSSITYEYAIDTGSGWSAWKTWSTTNLSAETVSATAGFRFKIRLTANFGATTNKVTSLWTTGTVDQSVSYPTAQVDLVLSNVVSGSEFLIFKTSDSSTIASGTASGSTVTVENVDYLGDVSVTIRVRKAGYVPFETGGTITSVGMATYVSQQVDNIYQ